MTPEEIMYSIKCIVCNCVKKNGVRKKFRFSYPQTAQEFLDAINFNKDDVKTRLADIDNAERLLANDIYCHPNCKRLYLMKFYNSNAKCILCKGEICSKCNLDIETAKDLLAKSEEEGESDISFSLKNAFDAELGVFKTQCFAHETCKTDFLLPSRVANLEIYAEIINPIIDDMIDGNYYLSISDIRAELAASYPGHSFYNHKIKKYLCSAYPAQLTFCTPYKKNESEIVYSSTVTSSAILAKLSHLNIAKQAGKMIRDALKKVDFGLQDSFCDSDDLNDSWNQTRMPECLIEFFTTVLNTRKADLISSNRTSSVADSDENEGDETDYESEDEDNNLENSEGISGPRVGSTKKKRMPKVRLANSFFQTLFYAVHNGKKKTPLHTMMAHLVYDISKSKELITTLGRSGYSLSYTEYRRCRDKLINYILEKDSDERVPLPSHLNRSDFTIAAIDNWDHGDKSSLSGTKSNHDSVTVLFQNKTTDNCTLRKPKLSDFTFTSDNRKMNPLKCQALETYQKPPTKKLSLPLDFPVVPNPTYEDSNVSKIVCTARNASIPSEFKINNDFPSPDWKTIPSWSGSHALLPKADVKLKVVGYLPVFPYPITKHESVYSLLINLNSIAISLEQDVLEILFVMRELCLLFFTPLCL